MIGRALMATLVAAHATLYWLGRTSGATRQERRAGMPGDPLVHCPQTVVTHAATLPAPPQEVWPWLVQMGWHRGGWYTPRWVDVLFFPDNYPSADEVRPELQDLALGSFVPDGPPESGCGFIVREIAPESHLVLESTSHLPLSWRQHGHARLHWTWAFALFAVDQGRQTRLVFRWRGRTTPWWLTAGAHLMIVPADHVMSHGMLRGLERRVSGGQNS